MSGGGSGGEPRRPLMTRSAHKRRRNNNSNQVESANQPGVFSAVPGTAVDKDVDYLCPVCFDAFKEAHMTKCGHSFCHACILRSLEQSPRCPKCNAHVDFGPSGSPVLFPNFALEEMVAKAKQRKRELNHKWSRLSLAAQGLPSEIKEILLIASESSEDAAAEGEQQGGPPWSSTSSKSLGLKDIDDMIRVLTRRRQEMERESRLTQHQLLAEFLTQLKRSRDESLVRLKRECAVIQSDLERAQSVVDTTKGSGDVDDDDDRPEPSPSTSKAAVVPSDGADGFNVFHEKSRLFRSSLPQRRRRMNRHFDDLVDCYFSCRSAAVQFGSEDGNGCLERFSSCLSRFTRYSQLHPLATLNYATDVFTTASIVSSIEFDKDNELFAIAGVTKRIKVYDYDVILKDMVDIHYPCLEMVCGSKISCVSWNSFHKGTLASSDYDCSVIIWDANTAQRVRTFQEHEKRCWSVDFNAVDTKLLASGSDDARVKLWSANVNHSVASLEAKANVCCVKFNPSSCYHIAFGSADHGVHYYDLRNPKQALNVFRGHKKAVSYVKFLNSREMVSASTDSQLKLWDVDRANGCVRSFTGHVNEKNFVGLATDGDYITCGSENNSLYMYYKGLSKPLFDFKFDAVRSVIDRDPARTKEEDGSGGSATSSEFVSAVCWRQSSPVVVAANSQGTIKVLELV